MRPSQNIWTLTILAELFTKIRNVANLAKSSNCLATANVLQLKFSGNCKCLTTANILQQTMSFRFLTESVWQLQMSDNCKYLATDNVFQPYAWKCLATTSVFTDNVCTDFVLHLKVSGNRKCHFGSKRTLSRNGRWFVTESVGETYIDLILKIHCKVIIGRNPIEANANTVAIQLPGNPAAYIGKCFTPY